MERRKCLQALTLHEKLMKSIEGGLIKTLAFFVSRLKLWLNEAVIVVSSKLPSVR